MTITETPPEADAEPSRLASPQGNDLAAVVGTGDHKRIGRFFIAGGLIGLVATLVAGLVLDAERVSNTSLEILTDGTVMQVLAFHRLGLVLLFALPALLGLAMTIVPLQVGASTLAFPRAAALSFWGWLLGSVLWIASLLVGGGPGGSDLRGTDLWLLATGMIIVALMLATVCVVTTVGGLRTLGMSLWRVPAFSFSMFVAGSVWLLTFPVAIANLILIYLDHRHAQVMWGANEAIISQLGWMVSQPQIYAIAIPVLGIVADQIPVFAGVRQRFYDLLFLSITLFGFLSVGAWAQSALNTVDLVEEPLFVGFGILAILPVLMILALGADTMRAGKVRPAGSLIMGLGAGLVLLGATVAGALRVIEPLELVGTTWDVGHTELVALAVVLGLFSGIWFWGAKIYGRLVIEGLGRAAGTLLVLAAFLATVPLLVAGALEQIDSVNPGPVDDPITALNAAATAGTAVVLLASLALILAILRGRKGDDETPADPWGGHTLEWAIPSPPPPGNFPEPPEVVDERPLLSESDLTQPQLTEAAEEGAPA